ncbi:hypothetical protein [Flectobacillus major]|uniref:hypothetical protein n=1 Tax=Flectobacillus major TaxID=103 RepID=UPI00041C7A18|nr:hypothetical protein [Flectobacillus major]
MKIQHFNIVLLTFLAIIGLTNCNTSPEKKEAKVEEAKADVVEATKDLQQARSDSVNEYRKYKVEAETRLAENERIIGEIEEKLKTEDAKTRASLEKDLNVLNQKNADLKFKIQNYEEGPKEKWGIFKQNFNRDMDALGKSISSLAEKNMKKNK